MKSISIKRLPLKLMSQLPKLQLQSHQNSRSLSKIHSLDPSSKKRHHQKIPYIDKVINKSSKCYTNITESLEQMEPKYSIIEFLTSSAIGKTELLKPRKVIQHNKSMSGAEGVPGKGKISSPKLEQRQGQSPVRASICKLPMIQPPERLVRERSEIARTKSSQVIKKYPPGLQFEFERMGNEGRNRRKGEEKKVRDVRWENIECRVNVKSWGDERVEVRGKERVERKRDQFEREGIERFELGFESRNDLLEYVDRKDRERERELARQKEKEKELRRQKQKHAKIKRQSKSKRASVEQSLHQNQIQQDIQIGADQIIGQSIFPLEQQSLTN